MQTETETLAQGLPTESPSSEPVPAVQRRRLANVDALGIPEADLREHRAAMLDLARRLLADGQHAEDVVNDAFLIACGKEKSQRPDEKNHKEVRAWLCALVRMAVLSFRHVLNRVPRPMSPEDLDESAARSIPPFVEERCILASAFYSLPLHERDLIARHLFDGTSIKEIADEDASPYSSVYSTYHRSLLKLRELLGVAALVLGLLVREARARAAALRSRIAASLARSPMRHLASVAAGAAIMAAMPYPRAQSLPADRTMASAIAMGAGLVPSHMSRIERSPAGRPVVDRRVTQDSAPVTQAPRERSPLEMHIGSAVLREKPGLDDSSAIQRPSSSAK